MLRVAASLSGEVVYGLPAADRVFRLSGKIPVFRPDGSVGEDAGLRQERARSVHLPQSHERRARAGGVEKKFALGCTPIVNLFRQRAEPIRLDNRSAEYRVVPDARRVGATEVYAIESVTGSTPDGRSLVFAPFFAVHHTASDQAPAYWHASRQMAANGDGGTEVSLSFVDGDFDPDADSNCTVSVETVCLNRDLPSRLPFGGGNPRLELVQASSAVARVLCVTAPTPTLRPPLGRGTRSRLVSHLVLNHLSITGGEDGANALRAILKLYDFHDSSADASTHRQRAQHHRAARDRPGAECRDFRSLPRSGRHGRV